MRPILPNERPLIAALFENAGEPIPASDVLVQPMDDGGMGSLAYSPLGRKLGATVSELQFADADGVLVCAALNFDDEGLPFELDIWRVDFKPLVRWPDRLQLGQLSQNKGSSNAA